MDYVKEVTHKKAFRWDEKDEQSANFKLASGNAPAEARNLREPLPPADIPIVAFDYGLKYNILRRLRQHGFGVQVLPATASAAEALEAQAGGNFSVQRPRRSGGARLHRARGENARGQRRSRFSGFASATRFSARRLAARPSN